jgi:hypothetical protein
MAHSDHPDAEEFQPFGRDPRQLDMFGSPPARNYDPDPEDVRAELLALLAKARAAPDVPWDSKEASLYRTVFPQMANWLPAEEAAQLRLAFAAELTRLEAA